MIFIGKKIMHNFKIFLISLLIFSFHLSFAQRTSDKEQVILLLEKAKESEAVQDLE